MNAMLGQLTINYYCSELEYIIGEDKVDKGNC